MTRFVGNVKPKGKRALSNPARPHPRGRVTQPPPHNSMMIACTTLCETGVSTAYAAPRIPTLRRAGKKGGHWQGLDTRNVMQRVAQPR